MKKIRISLVGENLTFCEREVPNVLCDWLQELACDLNESEDDWTPNMLVEVLDE